MIGDLNVVLTEREKTTENEEVWNVGTELMEVLDED